jgi:two-component sensor histidine kinase/putative methionine-R-sulfoxide reductase with GAF domain
MSKKSAPDPEAKLQRLLHYQRALAAFSRVAGGVMPPDRLMQYAAAQVSGLTHIRHVKIMRYRPDQGDLLVEAGVGWKPGVVGQATLAIDHASPPGRALQTAAPVIIEDLPNDPEFRLSDLLSDHGIVSVANVPILIDGQTWGVLEVDAAEPRGFDEADIGFMTAFGNMVGVALQRQKLEEELAAAAAECTQAKAHHEVVLRELQHRVKNNFQVILSFLALQRRHATTEDGRERFVSVMDRVHAIALAHDQLIMREGAGAVEFGDYLRALCANINPYQESVIIEVQADETHVPLDRAVPAGLIVNELVTNSLKYAFDEKGGTIRVTFAVDVTIGEGCIVVEDDGRGMPPRSEQTPRKGSLGLRLIEAFVQQLNGRIERDEVEKGTKIRACFPLAI